MSRRDFLRVAGVVAVAGSGLVAIADRARALTINPRSSWAIDRPPLGPLPSEDVRFLLVHHSASQNGHTSADAPGILRGFYDYHTSPEKGWNDIAYNFLIDAGGGVWEGRSGSIAGSVAGDATGGNQGFSQLVCVIGDYNSATPTGASLQSLVSLLAWLADKHSVATNPGAEVTFVSKGSNKWPAGTSVTTRTITGHRTMSNTTCPGDNLYSYVAGSLTADVDATRSGVVVAPTTQPPLPPVDSTPASVTSSSTNQLTTTVADAVPTPAPSGPTSTLTDVDDLTPTLLPEPVQASPLTSAPPPTTADTGSSGSLLLWSGAGLAALATTMLAWRYRRMS